MKAEINEGFPLITIGTQVVAVDRTRIPNVGEQALFVDVNKNYAFAKYFESFHRKNEWVPIIATDYDHPIDPSIPLIPRSALDVSAEWITAKKRKPSKEGTYEVMTIYATAPCTRYFTGMGFENYDGYQVVQWKEVKAPKAIIPEMEAFCDRCEKDKVIYCEAMLTGCHRTTRIKTIPSSIEGYREIVVKQVIR